jgi:pimeloyl-ACP methyl ester carboxylesterase
MTWLIGWFASHFLTNPRISRWLARYGAAPGHPPDENDIEFSYLLLKYFKRFPPPGRVEAPTLAKITAPTLIIMGQFERYYPLSQVILQAHRHLQNLYGVEIVANAGHDANKDQPHEVNRRLLAFLNPAEPSP